MNKCNPSKWVWGLIPVAAIVFLVVAGVAPKIEQDIAKRSAAALDQQGYYWAQLDFSGRDGVLTGSAINSDERHAALSAVSNIWGVSTVQDRAKLLPVADPFTWWATRKGNRIKIKGHIPGKADHQTILGIVKATMPELEIDDRMKLAAGAPPRQQWLGAISFALNQLGHLKNGSAALSGMELALKGEAGSITGYNAVKNALSARLPTGLLLTQKDIVPPGIEPYAWTVRHKSGKVVLTGHVPNDDDRRKLLDNVRNAFEGIVIEDRMQLGSGAPEEWARAVSIVVAQLARLEEGEAVLKDDEFAIDGIAADAETATDVADIVRKTLPANFKLTDRLRTRQGSSPEERSKAGSAARPEKILARPPVPGLDWKRPVILWSVGHESRLIITRLSQSYRL